MHRIDLDQSIVELDELLSLTDPASEDLFQDWAERNAGVFFSLLGFRRWLPHPRLLTPDGREFIPDFLAQTVNGLWEVVELKTAEPAIYKERERRSDFYQPIHALISQCRDYSEWLGHEPTKSAFEHTYATHLARHPSILMIAGAETNYNRQQVAENLSGRTPPMRLITWGDVLDMLNRYRVTYFGDTEVATGCTVILSLLLHRSIRPGVATIVDIGEFIGKNRVQLSLDGDQLMLLVFHSDGSKAVLPLRWSRRFDVATMMVIEVFVLNGSVNIRVECDRQRAAEMNLTEVELQLGPRPIPIVIGADVEGLNSAKITLALCSLIPKPVPPVDGWAIQQYAWHIGEAPDQLAIKFEGAGQFMYTEGHPLLDPGRLRTTNIVQRNDALRPTLISFSNRL